MLRKGKNINPVLPICPGELLSDELTARNISKTDFAKRINMSVAKLNLLLCGKQKITPQIASALAHELGIGEYMWFGFQKDYNRDLANERKKAEIKEARHVAEKLTIEADECGVELTPLMLQKILYYQQAYHFARFGTPLFADDIEAWQYGPVVPSVYQLYKKYGDNPIPRCRKAEPLFLYEEEILFRDVCDKYFGYTPEQLVRKTHREKPWREAIRNGVNSVITTESIREFFAKIK